MLHIKFPDLKLYKSIDSEPPGLAFCILAVRYAFFRQWENIHFMTIIILNTLHRVLKGYVFAYQVSFKLSQFFPFSFGSTLEGGCVVSAATIVTGCNFIFTNYRIRMWAPM